MNIEGIRSEKVSISVNETQIVKAFYNMLKFYKGQYVTDEGICHCEDHGCSHEYLVDVVETTEPTRMDTLRKLNELKKAVQQDTGLSQEVKDAFDQIFW